MNSTCTANGTCSAKGTCSVNGTCSSNGAWRSDLPGLVAFQLPLCDLEERQFITCRGPGVHGRETRLRPKEHSRTRIRTSFRIHSSLAFIHQRSKVGSFVQGKTYPTSSTIKLLRLFSCKKSSKLDKIIYPKLASTLFTVYPTFDQWCNKLI